MHRDTQPPQVLMVNIFLLSHIKNFSYCVEVFVFKLTKDKEFDKLHVHVYHLNTSITTKKNANDVSC